MISSNLSVSRVVLFDDAGVDEKVKRSWNSLVWQMEHPEIFFTFEWAVAVQRAFSSSLEFLTFVIRDQDELVGVAALASERGKRHKAFFLTANTADYCDVLSSPANRQRVIAALMKELKRSGVQELILANLPSDSITCSALRHCKSFGYWHAERPAYLCHLIKLGDSENRSTLKRSVNGKRQRQQLKKMTEIGPVSVLHLTQSEEINRALTAITYAQVFRFLVSGVNNPLLRSDRRTFLKELSVLLATSGFLDMTELRVGEKGIAWNLGFKFGDSWFWYLPTFDPDLAQFSPGSFLLKMIIDEACATPSLAVLDMGLGDEEYKSRFANAGRQTMLFHLTENFTTHVRVVARQSLTTWMSSRPRLKKLLQAPFAMANRMKRFRQKRGMLTFLRAFIENARAVLGSRNEIHFFEWLGSPDDAKQNDSDAAGVKAVSWRLLSKLAVERAGDEDSLTYLANSAERMRKSANQFYVYSAIEKPFLLYWVSDYNGFKVPELGATLNSPAVNAAIICDTWTPTATHDRHSHSEALRQAARQLQQQGRQPWIFAGAKNRKLLAALTDSGFEYRYSLTRWRVLWLSTLRREPNPGRQANAN